METLKFFSVIVTLLLAIIGGTYLTLEGEMKNEIKISINRGELNGKPPTGLVRARSDPSSRTDPIEQSPAPAARPLDFDNVTGLWISEISGKAYFIHQTDEQIEIFEVDERGRSVSVGKGARRGDTIEVRFHSTLDEVDGTLKLSVAEHGRSMSGGFVELGDLTKRGEVRFIRSA